MSFQEYIFDGGYNSSNTSSFILLHEKFLQFDWLGAVACENYKTFAGSSINK